MTSTLLTTYVAIIFYFKLAAMTVETGANDRPTYDECTVRTAIPSSVPIGAFIRAELLAQIVHQLKYLVFI